MPKARTKEKHSSNKTGARSRRAGHPVPGLIGPLLQFDLTSETGQLRQEAAFTATQRNAKTLVKYPDLRIVLIVMKSGTHIDGHKAAGTISIQALSGRLRLGLPDQEMEIAAGSLVTLERALPHDVEALKDSSFLLTISGPGGV